MFDDDDDEVFDDHLQDDLERFDAYLKGGDLGYLDSDRWEALIDHFMVNGHFKKAKTATEEALRNFPYFDLFKLRKAQVSSALGELKEAISILNELERNNPPSFEVCISKASVFSQLKDKENAIRYLKLSIGLAGPEDRDEVYLDLAYEYQQQLKFTEALEVLKEAIKHNPHNEGAVYEMAFCYEQMGDNEAAVACYTSYIDDNPYSFTAWYNLGNIYTRLGDQEKAIWAYEYSLLINEDFGPVYFNMANALMSMDDYLKAIENFNKSIALDGEDPLALCYLGECHEQLGDLKQASLYYHKSIDLMPELPDAWLGLGIVKDLEGHTSEALPLLHRALDLDPENAGICNVLAGAYEKLGERNLAEEYYQSSLNFDPEDESCLISYVEFLINDSPLVALDYLITSEEHGMINESIPLLKVHVYWLLGQTENALSLFRKIVDKDLTKAKEIYKINADLLNVPEFVHLTDQ